MLADLKLAWRRLQKAPGFAVATVLTLAVAIGSNGAIFSAVYAVLLQPAALRRPAELVVAWDSDFSRNTPVVELAYRTFEGWATASRSFDELAAMGSSNWPMVLEGRGDPVRLSATGASSSFFDTVGAPPFLGRTFRPADDVPNAAPVVVLSHGAWVRRFGADPKVLGQSIELSGQTATVVGVMPAAFDFPRGTDLWVPVVPILAGASNDRVDGLRDIGVLFVLGRLRAGVTPAMAAEELDQIDRRSDDSSPRRFGQAVIVTRFLDYVLGPVRPALWTLSGAALILLLIGCANISGLMLTRVSAHRREHAIQVALGATGLRIGRLWVFEALLLSLAGGALGLVTFHWIAAGIVRLAPDNVQRAVDVTMSTPVLAFTFVAIAVTALLCGAGPIRLASQSTIGPIGITTRDGTSARSQRGRGALMMLQTGLAVVLLVAAGLVVRSFVAVRAIALGFDPADVLTLNLMPRNPGPSPNQWFDRLGTAIAALPAVEAAGAVYLRPLALGPIGQDVGVLLEGQAEGPGATRQNPTLNYQSASHGYFEAMGVPLVAGRFFTPRDDERAERVTIVSASAARRLWPGQTAVGKRLAVQSLNASAPGFQWRVVVGVVADIRYRGLNDVRLDVYEPALQAQLPVADLVIKTTRSPLALAGSVQALARELDPGVVIDRITTLDAILQRAMAPWQFAAWMFFLFAASAFGLAAFGLFSLVMLDVVDRRHEFAVRLALGAEAGDIVRNVLTRAGWTALGGMGAGVLLAAAGARALRGLLFGVQPLDVTTYGVVIVLVLVVIAAAAYLPARRAAATDPLGLLRES